MATRTESKHGQPSYAMYDEKAAGPSSRLQSKKLSRVSMQAEDSDRTIYSAADSENTPTPGVTHCFRIDDSDKVEAFLTRCLTLLQQQVGKRIAKSWIKGICPRKQTRHPYQKKHRDESAETGPREPEWWPPTDKCPFREPDHIIKECMSTFIVSLTSA